jgi:hypothetical protein
MTADELVALKVRHRATLVTELKAIREAERGIDPRATLKARFDSTGTIADLALTTLLGFDRSLVTPGEFNEMVEYAGLEL